MIAAEDGEKRAIQLLPAYVNRDIADREAVRDIVKSANSLEEALSYLAGVLDPPMDTFIAMQEVSRLHWQPGIFLPPETKGYLRQIRVETRRFLIGRTSTKRCPNEN